jgi:hypothetical protein
MPTKIWIIYRLFRCHDGLSYIGQTRTALDLRRARLIRAACERPHRSPIYEALRASGESVFTAWGIESLACCATQRDADATEAVLIRQENTLYPNGFNSAGFRYRGT